MSLTEVKLPGEAPPLAPHHSGVSPGSAHPGLQTREPLGVSVAGARVRWGPQCAEQTDPLELCSGSRHQHQVWGRCLGTVVRAFNVCRQSHVGGAPLCSFSRGGHGGAPPNPPNHTIFLFYPPGNEELVETRFLVE